MALPSSTLATTAAAAAAGVSGVPPPGSSALSARESSSSPPPLALSARQSPIGAMPPTPRLAIAQSLSPLTPQSTAIARTLAVAHSESWFTASPHATSDSIVLRDVLRPTASGDAPSVAPTRALFDVSAASAVSPPAPTLASASDAAFTPGRASAFFRLPSQPSLAAVSTTVASAALTDARQPPAVAASNAAAAAAAAGAAASAVADDEAQRQLDTGAAFDIDAFLAAMDAVGRSDAAVRSALRVRAAPAPPTTNPPLSLRAAAARALPAAVMRAATHAIPNTPSLSTSLSRLPPLTADDAISAPPSPFHAHAAPSSAQHPSARPHARRDEAMAAAGHWATSSGLTSGLSASVAAFASAAHAAASAVAAAAASTAASAAPPSALASTLSVASSGDGSSARPVPRGARSAPALRRIGTSAEVSSAAPPSNAVLHFLRGRESFKSRPGAHDARARQVFSSIAPNVTVVLANAPFQFFKRFSLDGSRLLAFSRELQSLIVYTFDGPRREASESQHSFSDFFTFQYELRITRQREVLCRDFCLFVLNDSFVVLASSTVTAQPPGFARRGTQPDQRYARVHFHLVDLDNGAIVDTITFEDDFMYLPHHSCTSVLGDRLALLSIEYETIHLYRILPEGRFLKIGELGSCLSLDEPTELARHRGEQLSFVQQAESDGVPLDVLARIRDSAQVPAAGDGSLITGLKQRLLTHLYHAAAATGRPECMRHFLCYFDQFRQLRLWRMQLLDGANVLLKFGYSDCVLSRITDLGAHSVLFAVFDMSEARVTTVFSNSLRDYTRPLDEFFDFFHEAVVSQPSQHNELVRQHMHKQLVASLASAAHNDVGSDAAASNAAAAAAAAAAASFAGDGQQPPGVGAAGAAAVDVAEALNLHASRAGASAAASGAPPLPLPREPLSFGAANVSLLGSVPPEILARITPARLRSVKCAISVFLPFSPQLFHDGPFFDSSLFSFDEKSLSMIDRPKAVPENPIRFYARRTGRELFRLPNNVLAMPRMRRLMSYIFHPLRPFLLSITQSTTMGATVVLMNMPSR